MSGKKEKRFLDALSALFTGAEVDGESGFVNLMRIKKQYFDSIREGLMSAIDARAGSRDEREELFDKLWTFFQHYFCESGSIYFRHQSVFSKTYERVYADGRDVALAWKTQMLYYVKSDVLVQSMPVALSGGWSPRFYFDASGIEHKKNNEKKKFVFAFDSVKGKGEDKTLHLKVSYAKNGTVTNADDIIKSAAKKIFYMEAEDLQKAIAVFRRQTEVDFFINKDAGAFLREQFDLYLYQYMFDQKSIFDEKRIRQLQAIKDTAYDIIAFIAQFEDELCRIWEKPKFVRGVNYVVTLDRLSEKTLNKVIKSRGADAQVAEWQALGLVDAQFSMDKIFNGQKSLDSKNGTAVNRKFLPLDTKHFKELELDILNELGDLDESLDGELVHSENWQALNTLSDKYKGRVQCVYIDPPFNLGVAGDFDYKVSYKDASWATMLFDRIKLARDLLNSSGSIFVRCDYNGNFIVRCLLAQIFGADNFKNEIIVNRTQEFFKSPGQNPRKYMWDTDSVFLFSKTDDNLFNQFLLPRKEEIWWEPFLPARGESDDDSRVVFGERVFSPAGRIWGLDQETVRELENKNRIRKNAKGMLEYWPEFIKIKNNWTDIPGYAKTQNFATENAEVLLHRAIHTASQDGDVVLDFFMGSGTTQAVAHKLGKKWLGVEMGEHFHSVVLPRMKKVVCGHQSGISKDVKHGGGGAFKYYSLEQYEETLGNMRYDSGKKVGAGEMVELDSEKSPFEQYVFFADDKLSHNVGLEKGSVHINLHKLYPDMDIAESLANVLGKTIRRRDADSVTFADGSTEKTNPAKMTAKEQLRFISLIKPYLWWGRQAGKSK